MSRGTTTESCIIAVIVGQHLCNTQWKHTHTPTQEHKHARTFSLMWNQLNHQIDQLHRGFLSTQWLRQVSYQRTWLKMQESIECHFCGFPPTPPYSIFQRNPSGSSDEHRALETWFSFHKTRRQPATHLEEDCVVFSYGLFVYMGFAASSDHFVC